MLSPEQIKDIKKQIIAQIKNWQVPEEQKQAAISQVKAMNAEQLEQFLIKNKLIKQAGEAPAPEQMPSQPADQTQPPTQCPFCLILQKQIPSYIIDENKDSVAVLEINPLSKGHCIVIPKKHEEGEKIPSKAFTLARKVAKKIKTRLKPEEVSISTASAFGHGIINIIPIYKDVKPEKKKASEQDLKKLQEKLKTKPRAKPAIRKPKTKILEKAPRRIP